MARVAKKTPQGAREKPASKTKRGGTRPPARPKAKTGARLKAGTTAAPKKPVQKQRVRFEMNIYAARKDEIKAPLKKLGLKWQFLGQDETTTKGRYAKPGVNVFAIYTDHHADFSIWGSDKRALRSILSAWKRLPTVSAAAAPAPPTPEETGLAREVELWTFKKPAPRPGEPTTFFERRVREWEDQDPRKAGVEGKGQRSRSE